MPVRVPPVAKKGDTAAFWRRRWAQRFNECEELWGLLLRARAQRDEYERILGLIGAQQAAEKWAKTFEMGVPTPESIEANVIFSEHTAHLQRR